MKKTIIILCMLFFAPDVYGSLWLQVEGGPVWQSVNDVEIPYNTGTRFSLTDFSNGPWPYFRAYLGFDFGRHSFRALYAPLSVSVTGKPGKSIVFQGETYLPGSSLTGTYTFNSYRLTYAYALVDSPKWIFHLGFTGKVRDAEIRLRQGSTESFRDNIGFVPLLHLALTYRLNKRWAVILDADALVSPFGRAEDVSLLLEYSLHDRIALSTGYRTVEGGSDGGGKVYNFAWLHYAVVSARYKFF